MPFYLSFLILSVHILVLSGSASTLSISTESSRKAFARMEKGVALEITLTNHSEDDHPPVKAKLALDVFAPWVEPVPALNAGKKVTLRFPIRTDLRPDRYPYHLVLLDEAGQPLGEGEKGMVTIVPRPLPNEMPIILWGQLALTGAELLSCVDHHLKEIGFNAFLAVPNYDSSMYTPKRYLAIRQLLDELFRRQVNALATLSPGALKHHASSFDRMERGGERDPARTPNVNGNLPEAQAAFYEAGLDRARHFGDLPAFKGALLNTETRDHSVPSFSRIDHEAYSKASNGKEIPPEIKLARGVRYQALPDFPRSRVIPDDHPILAYYRWFWKEGDGWGHLTDRLNAGIKSHGRGDFFTWHDPAVRTPSIYGSGGNVDYLSHWTYTYPDPLKVALACEQLIAMAKGSANPDQQVMKMTQLIWYRSRTTRSAGEKGGEPGVTPAHWEQTPEGKNARLITIAPDHLSLAVWHELSYPIKGMMFHGWRSIVGDVAGEGEKGYAMTNGEARMRLKALIENVVKPLGPTLMQVSEGESDVAFLESFTSQMFAGRGAYGWGQGWGADGYLVARYAGLQPSILFEEGIARGALKDKKILFAFHCDVLTESTLEAISRFQDDGGIVVGDEFLCPALQPDLLVDCVQRTGHADQDKATLLGSAAELRRELSGVYKMAVSSENPEVIVRSRSYKNSQYLFVINDHRTFGDYVGQYGLVMEKGLPASSAVTVAGRGLHLYDLLEHRKVATTEADGATSFKAALEPGEGKLYLLTRKAVGHLKVQAAEKARIGSSFPIRITLPDENGEPLKAVVPFEVRLIDPQGRLERENSGYFGAKDGELKLVFEPAPNDLPGRWKLEVQEQATGGSTTHFIELYAP